MRVVSPYSPQIANIKKVQKNGIHGGPGKTWYKSDMFLSVGGSWCDVGRVSVHVHEAPCAPAQEGEHSWHEARGL